MKNASPAWIPTLSILLLVLGSAIGFQGIWKPWSAGAPRRLSEEQRAAFRRVESSWNDSGTNGSTSPIREKLSSAPEDKSSLTFPEKSTLLGRLESFRDLLRQQKKAEELSPSEGMSPWKRVDAVWLYLHRAVFEEPEHYLHFLRAPENESCCEGLLGLLSRAHLSPNHQLVTVGMDPLPQPVLEGMKEMLVTGKERQQLAILKLVLESNHLDVNSTRPIVEECKDLLADGNPRVQAAALGVLAAKGQEGLDAYF
jgi:hypothetical protein